MIKPYYTDDSVTIYNCDCREILPELPEVDLVLTDPPYGMNWDGRVSSGKNGHGGNHSKFKGVTIYGDNEHVDLLLITSMSCVLIIWGFHHFPEQLSKGSAFVWIKKLPKAFGTFLSDADLAWMNKGHGVYVSPVINPASFQNERVHPTQKPVSLMKWCIEQSGTNGVVLDPFMGSGTTLRAAKDLGRKAIGIELEEKYCEIAARRMSQEVFDFGD